MKLVMNQDMMALGIKTGGIMTCGAAFEERLRGIACSG